MIRLVPNSNGEDNSLPGTRAFALLDEYNHCHNPEGAAGGQFCATEGGGAKGPAKVKGPNTVAGGTPGQPRPIPGTAAEVTETVKKAKPIQVKTVEEAVALVLQGKAVEVENEAAVATLLDKLGAMVQDALDKGEDAPDYDLCNVSVKGTNLFCTERLRTKEHPEGIVRILMPQFTGPARPGSPADQLPRSVHQGQVTDRVDGALAFVDFLEAQGIEVGDREDVPAASLKATQSQLIGPKVAEMVLKGGSEGQGSGEPAFISSDGYVLDGHHRWAANVWRDLQQRRKAAGQVTMPVYRINLPISKLYHIAVAWTDEFGILPAAGGPKKKKK